MEQSLQAARKEWIGLFGEHTLPYACIAPNNIISEAGIAAVSGAGIWAHFIHADDIFDPYRSRGMSWSQLKREFAGMLDFVNRHYPRLRFVTIREAHRTLESQDAIGAEFRWLEGNRLEIRTTSPGLPVRIRMNGYRLRRSEGAKVLYSCRQMPAVVLEMEGTLATLEFSKQ
jgi:hypothetical protein